MEGKPPNPRSRAMESKPPNPRSVSMTGKPLNLRSVAMTGKPSNPRSVAMAGEGSIPSIICYPCSEEKVGVCNGCSLTKRFNEDGLPTFHNLRKIYSFNFLKKITPMLEDLGAMERFIDLHNFGSTNVPQAIPSAVMAFFTGISRMMIVFAEEVFHGTSATVQQREQFSLEKVNLPVAVVNAHAARCVSKPKLMKDPTVKLLDGPSEAGEKAQKENKTGVAQCVSKTKLLKDHPVDVANDPDWLENLDRLSGDPAEIELMLKNAPIYDDWYVELDAAIKRDEARQEASVQFVDLDADAAIKRDEAEQEVSSVQFVDLDADAAIKRDEAGQDAQDNLEALEAEEDVDAQDNAEAVLPIIDIFCMPQKGVIGRKAKYDVAKMLVFCKCSNPKCHGAHPSMFNGNHCKSRNWKKTVLSLSLGW